MARGKVLQVYELKGDKLPVNLPARGLVGVWPEAPYYYAFYWEKALDSIQAWLNSKPLWKLTARYELPYEKWQDVSRGRFEVGSFSIEALGFAGPGIPVSGHFPENGGHGIRRNNEPFITLRLDPGVVFGSGLHPTTRGCLIAISEVFSSGEISQVVDFGAGTGVLAIACALIGAKRVLAIDRNTMALEVARKNAGLNGVSNRIGLIAADSLQVLGRPAHLLLANLEWPILEEVLGTDSLNSYEYLILSGFLEGRLNSVKDRLQPWFDVERTAIIDGWPTLTLIRRRAPGASAQPRP